MIGAIIGAGLSAAGSIFGAATTSAANRRARREQLQALDKAEQRNENMFNYAMGTPRYSTQAVLNQTADVLRDRKAAREGARKVIGGTDASVQAGNQQDVEMLNNATQSAVNAALDDRQRAMQNYTENANNIEMQKAGVQAAYQQGMTQQTAQAVQGLTAAAGQIAGAIDSPEKTETKTAGNTTSKVAVPKTLPQKPATKTIGSEGGVFTVQQPTRLPYETRNLKQIVSDAVKTPKLKSTFNSTLEAQRRKIGG